MPVSWQILLHCYFFIQVRFYGSHKFPCRSLLLSTTVLNDMYIYFLYNVCIYIYIYVYIRYFTFYTRPACTHMHTYACTLAYTHVHTYGTAQLQGSECSRVSCVSLASFTHAAREYHVCHSRVMKLRVRSTTVYFYSSFSLQVTCELVNSRRSKQTTVLGCLVTPSQRWKPNSLKMVYTQLHIVILIPYNYLCHTYVIVCF